MKINNIFLSSPSDRGVVSIPHYIFLFMLLFLGYFVIAFVGYAIFDLSFSKITGQLFTEPSYLSPLLLIIIALLSFFTINNKVRLEQIKSVPFSIFLFVLYFIGYFIFSSILYYWFFISWETSNKQRYVESVYFFPLFLIAIGLLSFISVKMDFRLHAITIIKKLPIDKIKNIFSNAFKFLFLWIVFSYISGTMAELVIPDKKSIEYLAIWIMFSIAVPIIIS